MNNFENFFAGKVITDNFSEVYPRLNNFVVNEGDFIESRNGVVKEVLDFTTTITNPRKRCVGVAQRNMNTFFLIAEAIWIAAGKKDVEWLDIFNSNMKNYSDDGNVFHAPYGYRLRHWGRVAESVAVGQDEMYEIDQVCQAIKILHNDPDSRQVVMSIWNPDLDLGYRTKDLPCNDMVMLKVRDGKLITTIANRSNDLHLGLTTNIFQFSFLTELIAACLDIDLGTQTHHSQSLHVYTEMNDIWKKVSYDNADCKNIYDFKTYRKMDFNFSNYVPTNRWWEIDYHLQVIIDNITSFWKGGDMNLKEIKGLENFSKFLFDCFELLLVYVAYKKELKNTDWSKNELLKNKIKMIRELRLCDWDFGFMCMNFFAARMQGNIVLDEEYSFGILGYL